MDAINPTNHTKVNYTGAKFKMESFEDNITNLITNLKNRAEREVCEYGSFAPVNEKFQVKDAKLLVDKLILRITPLPRELKSEVENFEKLRYLELVGVSQNGTRDRLILKRGTKEEILKKLEEKDLSDNLQKTIKEISDNFRAN